MTRLCIEEHIPRTRLRLYAARRRQALAAKGGEAVGEGFGVDKFPVAAKTSGFVAESPCVVEEPSLDIRGGSHIQAAGQHFEDVDEVEHGGILTEEEAEREYPSTGIFVGPR